MIKQIKKYGNSHIIILDKDYLEWTGYKIGDWIEIPDSQIKRVKKNGRNDNSKKRKATK